MDKLKLIEMLERVTGIWVRTKTKWANKILHMEILRVDEWQKMTFKQ